MGCLQKRKSVYDQDYKTKCFHIFFLVVDQRTSRGGGEAQTTVASSRNAFWKRNDSGTITGKWEIDGGSVVDLGAKRKTNGTHSSGISIFFTKTHVNFVFCSEAKLLFY